MKKNKKKEKKNVKTPRAKRRVYICTAITTTGQGCVARALKLALATHICTRITLLLLLYKTATSVRYSRERRVSLARAKLRTGVDNGKDLSSRWLCAHTEIERRRDYMCNQHTQVEIRSSVTAHTHADPLHLSVLNHAWIYLLYIYIFFFLHNSRECTMAHLLYYSPYIRIYTCVFHVSVLYWCYISRGHHIIERGVIIFIFVNNIYKSWYFIERNI